MVLVADSNLLRGTYNLAKVCETHPGKDGKVRTATLTYKKYRIGEAVREYKGAIDVKIKRSVQRLVRLVTIEDFVK